MQHPFSSLPDGTVTVIMVIYKLIIKHLHIMKTIATLQCFGTKLAYQRGMSNTFYEKYDHHLETM